MTAESRAGTGEGAMRREIGMWLAVFIIVNATIGTGIFRKPSEVARLTGSLDAYFGVWIAGGVIALCGALTVAELASALPRTGGIYEYLRRAYGRVMAFTFGWAMLVLLIPSAVGSFARLAGEALMSLANVAPNETTETVIAMAIVGGCTLANLAGIRTSARMQAIVAAAKYGGVMALGFFGLFLVGGEVAHVPPPAEPLPFQTVPTWSGFFAALVSVMWAYDGWADLSRVAGEVREPARIIPRALVMGSLAIVAVYGFANIGYVNALEIEGLRNSTTGSNMVAANLAKHALGAVGSRFFSALILVSCVGACMATLLTSPRVFVAMASDGLFPVALGKVTERTGTPTRALIVVAMLGAAYVAFRSFEELTDSFVVGYFPFYMLAVIAVPVLRAKEPALLRPFRVPLYPAVPLVFLLGASALMIGSFVDTDRTSMYAFLVMLLGVPIAVVWTRLRPAASR